MTHAHQRLRVAIHIAVVQGVAGGTAQSTQGLISSLGKLEGPERYLLAVSSGDEVEWVQRHLGPNQEIVYRNAPRRRAAMHPPPAGGGRVKALVRPAIERVRQVVGRFTPQWPRVSLSDGFYESLGCDVVHFPTQPFVLCALPTIYNPHDLQHLHYPQFWTAEDLAWRETVYRAGCNYANTVAVGSEWIKQDVVRQYGLHPDKVQVIPWAPPTAQYAPIDAVHLEDARRRLALPETFALYPAVTWPHKNHLRLFDALAELRDRRGLVVNLICTGARWERHWPALERRIAELNLAAQVRFPGFLSEADLRAVYRLAQFLVLPTLFEADSCPIYEAWAEGLPVASSNHTALPDQVGDAGLLFDAADVNAIADAVQRMATDERLRSDLVARGHRRVRHFDWTRTAKAYRALYRRAARIPLSEEDRWLLSWDWMRFPEKSPEAAFRLLSGRSA
jgi:glycosyltransferase involved in cell wall biosynthesis